MIKLNSFQMRDLLIRFVLFQPIRFGLFQVRDLPITIRFFISAARFPEHTLLPPGKASAVLHPREAAKSFEFDFFQFACLFTYICIIIIGCKIICI